MREFRIPNGAEVKDMVTGFKGIVTARHDYMFGCIMYSVTPQELHEGKPIADKSFDEARLEVLAYPKEGAWEWKPKSDEIDNAASEKPPGGPERHRPSRG